MRVLITGLGSKLAYKIRARQIGKAMKCHVVKNADRGDIERADLVVVVKWLPEKTVDVIRKMGKPWVWDMVDVYPHEQSHKWSQEEAIAWLQETLYTEKPTAMVGATRRMFQDSNYPGFFLPHHHMPRLKPAPFREKMQVLGYEGMPKFLGRYKGFLEEECKKRGWKFVINPESLHELDAIVALRDRPCYVNTHWKSNVKQANAHASGLPFIAQRECGYLENTSGKDIWADTDSALINALDMLCSKSLRKEAREVGLKHSRQYDISNMVSRYQKELRQYA